MTTSDPLLVTSRYGGQREIFPLPTDEAFLHDLLRELFEQWWPDIVFGPIVEGAAYEFRCHEAPRHISLHDGYLTVDLGGPHFHLCIGETAGMPGRPTPDAQRRHRRTAQAELFRSLDPQGRPVSWGLSLANGHGEQLLTVFFPNPFLAPDGRVAAAPDFSRLALWRSLQSRFLGRGPDPKDEAAPRFHHG